MCSPVEIKEQFFNFVNTCWRANYMDRDDDNIILIRLNEISYSAY